MPSSPSPSASASVRDRAARAGGRAHVRLGRLGGAALCALAVFGAPAARAEEFPEYRLKAAFIFNFMAYTEWPAETGSGLTLCLVGPDSFGKEIDNLQGKTVGGRSIAVVRRSAADPLRNCQAVFIAAAAQDALPRILESVHGLPVLTVADSPGATRRGVVLNMNVAQERITFEANTHAARSVGLGLSSKLLRLATEVLP